MADEPCTSQDTRPSKLGFLKTRLVEGRQFIDTSSEDCEATPVAIAAEPSPNPNDHMVSFVVADLQERIKLTSPAISGESTGKDSTFTATTTSSSGSPSHYPPLVPDAQVLLDLETQAKHISVHLGQVIKELSGSVHGMTDLTVECVENYNETINSTCDSVDSSIKSMYQLMAKTEELLLILRPLPKLGQQIRDIRRMLDMFESHLQKTVG